MQTLNSIYSQMDIDATRQRKINPKMTDPARKCKEFIPCSSQFASPPPDPHSLYLFQHMCNQIARVLTTFQASIGHQNFCRSQNRCASRMDGAWNLACPCPWAYAAGNSSLTGLWESHSVLLAVDRLALQI